jgi:2'-5' RNA ligase
MTDERLFFALWPDARVRRGLLGIRDGLPGFRGRPTHPEDMHITLVFLGQVEPERRACVERAVAAVRGRPFELQIDQVGFWGRPRILWCGPGSVPDELQRLVGELKAVLADCGFEPERRPYAAHVTLARKARPVRFQELERPLSWPVGEFVLVASGRGGEPPRYRVLKRWRLG